MAKKPTEAGATNLSNRLRAILDDTDVREPTEIAEIMERAIMKGCTCRAKKSIGAALREALISWTRARFNGLGPSMLDPDARRTGPTNAISSKWREVRAELSHCLRGVDGYKKLGEFTIADLQFSATLHREQARANERKAEQLEEIAGIMQRAKLTYVRDIPEDKLKDIFVEDLEPSGSHDISETHSVAASGGSRRAAK